MLGRSMLLLCECVSYIDWHRVDDSSHHPMIMMMIAEFYSFKLHCLIQILVKSRYAIQYRIEMYTR